LLAIATFTIQTTYQKPPEKMMLAFAIFFLSLFIVLYSYLFYGIFIWLSNKMSHRQAIQNPLRFEDLPATTLLIAAYNEALCIEEKILNSLKLQYPDGKLEIMIVTDGSTDETPEIVRRYPMVTHLHEPQRKGKVVAVNRALQYVKTPIVVFSDANTFLSENSLVAMNRHYGNPAVGGVAGEKKVIKKSSNNTAGVGEGMYWKYESWLKKQDWIYYSVVGAAGELYSVRTALYEHPGDNIILDDFVGSLRICEKGYRFAYEPSACATEYSSASMQEEQKRKIRISAGAFQAMAKMKSLLDFTRHGKLSFQYISHRVLRWTACPPGFVLLLASNAIIVCNGGGPFYQLFLLGQTAAYLMALAGWLFQHQNWRPQKLFQLAYYFVFIQVSLMIGFNRYINKNQTVVWEKAKRA
jgi:poly-beta-1,6-N-acetyl-D-glucosamine synthase